MCRVTLPQRREGAETTLAGAGARSLGQVRKSNVQAMVTPFMAIVLGATSLGYLLAPQAMLAIVGIEGDPVDDFLVRALAAALLGLIPTTWGVRKRQGTSAERRVLLGITGYLILSAAVDLHAYASDIVGALSIPSIAVRVLLGSVFLWLTFPERG